MTKQEFLAMSLPYEIKLIYRNDKSWPIIMAIGNLDEILHTNKDYKPILRPLSDLTKEIEHKGEKFVPIIKLIEIAFGGEEIDTNRVKFSFEDDMYIAKISEVEFGFDTTDNSFVSHFHSFASYIPSQLLLFQKLIEWHFDLITEECEKVYVTETNNPY